PRSPQPAAMSPAACSEPQGSCVHTLDVRGDWGGDGMRDSRRVQVSRRWVIVASVTMMIAAAVCVGHASSAAAAPAGTVTRFQDPGIAGPTAIAAGPDGALWFCDPQANAIGRMTTDGHVTMYSSPDIVQPKSIAAGADGALWFTIQKTRTF